MILPIVAIVLRERFTVRRNYGFTLIELLIVISIIALLLGILVGSLRKAREQANRVICKNHLKTLAMANEVYQSRLEGRYVPVIDESMASQNRPYWITNRAYRKYIGLEQGEDANMYVLPEEYWCPSDRRVRDEAYWPIVKYKNRLSYAYNMTDYGRDSKDPYPWAGPMTGSRYVGFGVTNVDAPANKVMFIDAGDFWTEMEGADYVKHWDEYGDDIEIYRNWELGLCSSPVMFRHDEGANTVLFDIHVEYRKKQTMFYYVSGPSDQPDINRNRGIWFIDPQNSKK
jgi:prepilin-type N-terminal cleavage/methylation domain-containing protein